MIRTVHLRVVDRDDDWKPVCQNERQFTMEEIEAYQDRQMGLLDFSVRYMCVELDGLGANDN